MENQTPLQNPGKPQRWGNYLKEFIMIFLAIMLGFFVENLREDLAEKEMVREYMQELVGNLQYDTTRCRLNLETNALIFKGLDSLRYELKTAIEGKADINELYYLAFKYRGVFGRARFNTTAMSELKNSGSIRLIENKELVNHLGDYYQRKIFAAENSEPKSTLIESMEAQGRKIFSMRYMESYIQSFEQIEDKKYNPEFNFRKLKEYSSLELLSQKQEDLETYLSMVSSFEISLRYYVFWLKLNQKTAIDLITKIKKEYHFKEMESGKE